MSKVAAQLHYIEQSANSDTHVMFLIIFIDPRVHQHYTGHYSEW